MFSRRCSRNTAAERPCTFIRLQVCIAPWLAQCIKQKLFLVSTWILTEIQGLDLSNWECDGFRQPVPLCSSISGWFEKGPRSHLWEFLLLRSKRGEERGNLHPSSSCAKDVGWKVWLGNGGRFAETVEMGPMLVWVGSSAFSVWAFEGVAVSGEAWLPLREYLYAFTSSSASHWPNVHGASWKVCAGQPADFSPPWKQSLLTAKFYLIKYHGQISVRLSVVSQNNGYDLACRHGFEERTVAEDVASAIFGFQQAKGAPSLDSDSSTHQPFFPGQESRVQSLCDVGCVMLDVMLGV